MANLHFSLDNISEPSLWGLLYYAGYITPTTFVDSDSSLSTAKFRIPNFEVRSDWVDWLSEHIAKKEGNPEAPKMIKSLLDPLMEGDAEQIQKALSTLLLNHFSYFSSSSTVLEKVYHAFLYGLLLCLTAKGYVVNVEQEAGYGRYDTRCQKTIGGNSKAIIIELRAVPLTVRTRIARKKKTEIQLEKDMEVQLLAAMNQLEERQYYSSLESHITTA